MARFLTGIPNWTRSLATFETRSDTIGDEHSKMRYLAWLKKFEIPFEEKYVFKFVE
jgi:hypothetical protein